MDTWSKSWAAILLTRVYISFYYSYKYIFIFFIWHSYTKRLNLSEMFFLRIANVQISLNPYDIFDRYTKLIILNCIYFKLLCPISCLKRFPLKYFCNTIISFYKYQTGIIYYKKKNFKKTYSISKNCHDQIKRQVGRMLIGNYLSRY